MPDPSPPALRAPSSGRPQASEAQAVCVYAEPLVSGRRVVVVGDASLGLGERLLELGARTVQVYDPDAARAEQAVQGRGLVVRALPPGELDVRDGAFDVAIVFDLGAVPKREELLVRLRRLLARGGAALIGARAGGADSREALDYYELYDLVALQFSQVRMIAEVPFSGVALADLGLEGQTPEVSVDTQLAGEAEDPARFFALGSQEEVRLSEYAIIKLPSQGPEPAVTAREHAPSRTDADAARAAVAEAQLRASLLEAQIDELKIKAARQAEGLAEAHRAAELEGRLAEEAVRRDDAETRAKEHYVRAERLAHEMREASAELSRERDQATALEGALVGAEASVVALRGLVGGLEERLAQREGELRDAVSELEVVRVKVVDVGDADLARMDAVEARARELDLELGKVAEHHATELAELERALRERAQVVIALEQEVARRERIVRELLGSLEEVRSEERAFDGERGLELGSPGAARERDLALMEVATLRKDLESRDAATRVAGERAAALGAANDELRARLDAMAMEMARREGERQDVAWRVAELEQQISRLEAEQTELVLTLPPPPPHAPGGYRPEPQALGGGKSQSIDGLTAERVAELQAEIDVLRQAMAQEHEARVRAESGDELTKARAEVARQALLLEQLSKELDARDRARLAESAARASSEA
jgi:hypothetical protein